MMKTLLSTSAGLRQTAAVAVTSITRSGSTATVTTTSSHGWSTGDHVRVLAADQGEYNTKDVAIIVTGASTFTYAVIGTPVSPATGTITVSKNPSAFDYDEPLLIHPTTGRLLVDIETGDAATPIRVDPTGDTIQPVSGEVDVAKKDSATTDGYYSEVEFLRPVNTTAYSANDVIGTGIGTVQIETATAVGTITAGTAQVETAVIAGTIDAAGAGDVEVIVTAAGMANSPKTILVAVANDDTAAVVAGKIRTALGLDADVTGFFTVSGADENVILTRLVAAADDVTMNIAVDNETSVGLTPDAESNDTTPGVAPGTGNAAVTVTGAGITGSPLLVNVAVTAGDTANTWAGKVRTALSNVAAITALYAVSGATDAIILTSLAVQANDASLNIALDNGTSTGITPAPSSANTQAGSTSKTNSSSAILEFANIGPAGSSILITRSSLRIDLSALSTGMGAFRLHLYTATPTAVLDNAAWDLPAGDRANYIGYIDIGTIVDVGSTLHVENEIVRKQVRLVTTSLYGLLVTLPAITTSNSAANHALRLHAIAV